MADRGLHHLTLAQASASIREGTLQSTELTRHLLDRIDALDSRTNAYLAVCKEQALADAEHADSEIAKGVFKGPLHGIPVAIKDIIDIEGSTTTCHSAVCSDQAAAVTDSTAVRRLRAAGAVILGKTATWEFAVGGTSFDLPWPPARNPWDLERDPAGSSSGSASAIAAGMGLGALGTDTGGSIRGPAAWTGIAGFKPTYGLVSRAGVTPLSFSQDHVGPMCWSAEDCALVMQSLAGYDKADPSSARHSKIDFISDLNNSVAGMRIGIVRHFYESDAPADANVVEALESAVRTFEEGGCKVSDVSLAPLQHYSDISNLIERAESFAIHQSTLTERPELYGEIARARIGSGAFISAADYINAQRRRRLLINHARTALKSYDAVLMPTRGNTAPPLGKHDVVTNRQVYTRPFNLLGFPALSVCSGFSTEGLPLSLQIAGKPFSDAVVLKLGHFFEKMSGHRTRRPVL
ncbi:amidase [Caballeronia sp. LZ001]|uniref:amidase n=1 Tax=Caballeronia sp. LZ001 TaxID=3038553 RepID=UPI002855AD7E|nr:amidase [Caballeronia sp. LZ001]MDR5804771.1 amidase [Caballeronia sp. LZ001]